MASLGSLSAQVSRPFPLAAFASFFLWLKYFFSHLMGWGQSPSVCETATSNGQP